MISSPRSIARQAKTLTPALRARFSHLHIADHAAQPTSPWRGHHPAVWGRASSFGRGRTMRLIRFLRLSTPSFLALDEWPDHGPQDPIAEREALGRGPRAKAAPGIGRLGCGTTRTCTPPRRPLACSLKSHGSSGSHTVPSIRVGLFQVTASPLSGHGQERGSCAFCLGRRERLLSPRHRRPLGHRLLGAGHGPSRRAEGARPPRTTRPSAPPHRAFISVATKPPAVMTPSRVKAPRYEAISAIRRPIWAGKVTQRLAVLRRRIPEVAAPANRKRRLSSTRVTISTGRNIATRESDDHAMDAARHALEVGHHAYASTAGDRLDLVVVNDPMRVLGEPCVSGSVVASHDDPHAVAQSPRGSGDLIGGVGHSLCRHGQGSRLGQKADDLRLVLEPRPTCVAGAPTALVRPAVPLSRTGSPTPPPSDRDRTDPTLYESRHWARQALARTAGSCRSSTRCGCRLAAALRRRDRVAVRYRSCGKPPAQVGPRRSSSSWRTAALAPTKTPPTRMHRRPENIGRSATSIWSPTSAPSACVGGWPSVTGTDLPAACRSPSATPSRGSAPSKSRYAAHT